MLAWFKGMKWVFHKRDKYISLANVLSAIEQVWVIFTNLKLWIHNFKLVKITIV